MYTDLPPMPSTMPAVLVIHPADDNYIRLRGGEWFDLLREFGWQVITSGDVDEAGGVTLPASKPLLVLSSLDGEAANVDSVLALAAHPNNCVLVDVCGPIWDPGQLVGVESREFWSDPEHQRQARRLMAGADGLTTPHVHHVEPLMVVNPNVFLLPDLVDTEDDEHDCEATARFGRALMLAWHSAGVAKNTPTHAPATSTIRRRRRRVR